MNYQESVTRLKKIVTELKKEQKEIEVENEKSDLEINEIKKNTQERIAKLILAKKKKLKTKEIKVSEFESEKLQILGSIFAMYTQGKITKEELDLAGTVEAEKEKKEEEIEVTTKEKQSAAKEENEQIPSN